MRPEDMERARSLRANGYTAKQIARALGLPQAAVVAFIRQSARSDRRSAAERELKACWVNAGWSDGLLVDERDDWPDRPHLEPAVGGLVAVLVARDAGRDKVSVCGYLVDVYFLGIKNVIGPRLLNDQQHAQFTRTFYAVFEQPPIAAPIELAQQLVLGGVRYARGFGLEPAPGFDEVRGHLGEWSGDRAITFGYHGRPFYVQGPHDDPRRIAEALRRTEGRAAAIGATDLIGV
ncbi:MAG TPA: hypothetical protein VIU11_09995 [Nakamurella sp.]